MCVMSYAFYKKKEEEEEDGQIVSLGDSRIWRVWDRIAIS